jgi:hypothetical protein
MSYTKQYRTLAGNNSFIPPHGHFHESYKAVMSGMKLNLGMRFTELSGTNNAVLLTTEVLV